MLEVCPDQIPHVPDPALEPLRRSDREHHCRGAAVGGLPRAIGMNSAVMALNDEVATPSPCPMRHSSTPHNSTFGQVPAKRVELPQETLHVCFGGFDFHVTRELI